MVTKNSQRFFGIFDKIGLTSGVHRDNPRGTTYYLGANIRVGLLPDRESNLQGAARHMVSLVRRDVDIISASHVETAREPLRDESGNIATFQPSELMAKGPGTMFFSSPFTGNLLSVDIAPPAPDTAPDTAMGSLARNNSENLASGTGNAEEYRHRFW